MRPDEHKKKRSAQYQRKHGGSKEKSADEGKKEKQKDKQSGAGKRPLQQSAPPPQNADLSTSDSEDEGGSSSISSQKTYRRREITSNWGKYDIPPADANESTATPKGQDFNKLLDLTGSGVAHFRFKEEQAWEAELEKDDTSIKGQGLTLDCDQLATSLSCLPLYKQLRLDKSIFTLDQLAEMDQVASKNQAFLPSSVRDKEQHIGTEYPSLTAAANSLASVTLANSENKTVIRKGNVDKVEGKGIESSRTESSESKNVGHAASNRLASAIRDRMGDGATSAGISDEALDSLLESGDSAQDDPRTVAAAASANSGGFSDKDLDFLLSLDTGTTQPPKDKQPTSTETKAAGVGAASESADFEDWLDSVLDS